MSDIELHPLPALDPAQNLSIGEVSAEATVLKCMGRTYVAVAEDDEVRITDTTDITHPFHLGRAKSRHENGAWDIVTSRNDLVGTTRDLLSAVAALRESTPAALLPIH
jgi:hypothetical protein